jgi:tryptophanyl-tRNA synthetase
MESEVSVHETTRSTTRKRVLSGLKPSGGAHIGNYFGALRQFLPLQERHENFIFVADYHAMTTVFDGEELRRQTHEMMLTLLAVGLDPNRSILFRQSDVPEVCELTWILACSTPHGLLERAHAYKDAVAKGEDVSAGLFNYPVLMASDILIYKSHYVPVGKDQKQHVEIARDIAQRFNATYGDILVLPEATVQEETATVIGLDGRKMSKSYDNTIMLFESEKSVKKKVMSIVTDSTPLGQPLNPDTCSVFALHRLFDPDGIEELRARYLSGSIGYGDSKKLLFEKMMAKLGPVRERYEELRKKPDHVEDIFRDGANRARAVARGTVEECRRAVGATSASPPG